MIRSRARGEELRQKLLNRKGANLTKKDFGIINELQLRERIITLMLENRSRKEIAQALGLTIHRVNGIIQSPEFKEDLNEAILDLTRDPRREIAKQQLADLLPLAMDRLEGILKNPNVRPSTLLNTIKLVLELNGIQPSQAVEGDTQEFREFLQKLGVKVDGDLNINLTQVNQAPMPDSYQEALKLIEPPVEGEVIDQ